MENLKYERFIEILDIEKKEKVTNAPLLFDLTSLQVACNKRFGLKASETEKVYNHYI